MAAEPESLRWHVRHQLCAEYYRLGLSLFQALERRLWDASSADEIRSVEHELHEWIREVEAIARGEHDASDG